MRQDDTKMTTSMQREIRRRQDGAIVDLSVSCKLDIDVANDDYRVSDYGDPVEHISQLGEKD